jgi:hypothetical protein
MRYEKTNDKRSLHQADLGKEKGAKNFLAYAIGTESAQALVELATTGHALREGDFKTLGVNDVERVVERARKKIDVRLGRYEWRAVHTLAGDVPEAKRLQFRPGEGVRWVLVVPGDPGSRGPSIQPVISL